MIRFESVKKSFKVGHWPRRQIKNVLNGFSFDAHPGEILGLIGRNGSGKTTSFKILAGLEHPDSGHIEIGGYNPVTEARNVRKLLALLPENPNFSRVISGRDALLEYGILYGLSKSSLLHRIDELTEQLGARELLQMTGAMYSRGQAVRMALVRTLIPKEANYLVLDEPTVGLDFETARTVRNFIIDSAKQGKTIVLATHLLGDIRTLCTRVTGLQDGQTVNESEVLNWLNIEEKELEKDEVRKTS